MLTPDDVLTSSGKYPDRAKSAECTQETKDNVAKLIVAVNSLLEDLGITEVKVSSGFRTASANAALPNSAKKSNHCLGRAVDLEDKDGALKALVLAKPDLLHKHQLWMESKESTPTWMHLDNANRIDRPLRVFKP